MIGIRILIVSELLIEALDLRSTERLLDVATGSGNAALAEAFESNGSIAISIAVPLRTGG